MSRGQNSGGPWDHAEDFMEGFHHAKRAGMTWEYVESFLNDFAQTKDAFVAKAHALREWDIPRD